MLTELRNMPHTASEGEIDDMEKYLEEQIPPLDAKADDSL